MPLHGCSGLPPYLFFLLLFRISSVAAASGGGCYMDAIYSFGDSFADTGNFVRLNPAFAFLFLSPPYGITIGKATGRLSDGLLLIDDIALKLGVPLLPPYLDKNASFTHGVNFAVAGATALDYSFLQSNNITNPSTNNSLGVQLLWFTAQKNSLCSSNEECAKLFDRSLFVVGAFGGNDFGSILVASSRSIEEARRFSPLAVGKIISSAEELIEAGAAHLIVPGNLPFGCAPFFLTALGTNNSKDYDRYGCFKPMNKLVRRFNKQVKKGVYRLSKEHPSLDIIYADFYGAFMAMFRNPDLYGFDAGSLTKACCGVGGRYNFDANRLCGTPETTVCRSPSTYIFWDHAHLTQAAYKVMTAELLSRGLVGRGDEPWRKWICNLS